MAHFTEDLRQPSPFSTMLPGGMLVVRMDDTVVDANDQACSLLGRDPRSLIGSRARTLVDDADRPAVRAATKRVLDGELSRASVTCHMNVIGSAPILTTLHITLLRHSGGLIAYFDDPQMPLSSDGQLEYLSRYDGITGLQNRAAISTRVRQALAEVGGDDLVAVCAVDIDRFRTVNDQFGHDAGDHVLNVVGRRLAGAVGHADVGRWGADEFVVVLGAVGGAHATMRTARRLQHEVNRPILYLEKSIDVSISIGISIGTECSAAANALIQRAEIALHRARSRGRSLDIVNVADAEEEVRSLRMETELLAAMRDDDLALAFQPIQSLDSGLLGLETLIRWPGSDLSAIEIIEIAERSAMIAAVNVWVLDHAVAQLPALCEAAGHDLRLSINWSAKQLHDEDVPRLVERACTRHGVDPSQLCIELTETTSLTDQTSTLQILRRLRDMGVGVSIDDFGIGYSSFAYLRDLPVTEVKLDRSFVQQAARDPAGVHMLEGMARLCRGLGLEVIGEGVETEADLALVIDAGCTAWQGYYSAPPMFVDELVEHLASRAAANVKSAQTLDGLMERVGMVDALVFTGIGEGRYAHLGGRGRGEGWAGIVEIDLACEPAIADVLGREGRVVACQSESWQVVGPYYATSAAIVLDGDHLVVFGHPDASADPHLLGENLAVLAELAVADVVAVSPAKPLADELEVLQAVQQLLRFGGAGMADALLHLLTVVLDALGCDAGVAWTPTTGPVSIGVDASDGLGAALCRVVEEGPRCVQRAGSHDLPDRLVETLDVLSWYAMPINADGGVIMVAHTSAAPRGFTTLCQRLGRTLVESSEVLFSSAALQETLRQQVALASTEARTDPVTGLLNRKAWDEEVERQQSGDTPNGAIILDINNFKAINDGHGHEVGDHVLRAVATRLATNLPDTCVAARLGGDEFGVLAVGISRPELAALRDEVDAWLNATADVSESTEVVWTVAVGCEWAPYGEDLPAAVCRADRHMYEQKSAQARCLGQPRVAERFSPR